MHRIRILEAARARKLAARRRGKGPSQAVRDEWRRKAKTKCRNRRLRKGRG